MDCLNLLMYSAPLPVGKGHLPAMHDSQRKNQEGPAVPEAKPERRKPRGERANEEKDQKAGLFQQAQAC